jgi:hypothetical protein
MTEKKPVSFYQNIGNKDTGFFILQSLSAYD